jgi:hypothetical protein
MDATVQWTELSHTVQYISSVISNPKQGMGIMSDRKENKKPYRHIEK